MSTAKEQTLSVSAQTFAYTNSVVEAWDRFWFTPSRPHTLAAIRILGGAMLLYTHLVWTLDLNAFLGKDSWVTSEVATKLGTGTDGRIFTWSYLSYVESGALLWTLHIAALIILAMLTIGLWTRVTSVLSFIIAVSYCHRLTGSLFGLDQINVFIAMYLMIAPCGAAYSVDRWLRQRRGQMDADPLHVSTTIATRLLQLHMCVIYLFGGIGKMRGELWWDGSAAWFAAANQEYQSVSLTWLVYQPWLIALITHLTVFWETFYPVLVWPKLTRPLCLAMAVVVHGSIAIFLGMPTFGLAMIVGNMVFVSPEVVQQLAGTFLRLGEPHSRPVVAMPTRKPPTAAGTVRTAAAMQTMA